MKQLPRVIVATIFIAACGISAAQQPQDTSPVGATVELHVVYQGEGEYHDWMERVVCPQNGGDVDKHMQQQCGTRRVVKRNVFAEAGSTCGYTTYIYACVKE